MSSLLLILLSAVLVSVVAIDGPAAWRPFRAQTDVFPAARMLAAVMLIVTPLVSVSCWLLYVYVLAPLNVEYLRTFVLVAVLIAFIFGAETILRMRGAELARPGFILILSVNGVALGVALFTQLRADSVMRALGVSVTSAGAYALLLLAFASMHERLRGADAPAPFRHAPLALITAGLMALGLLGFSGLVQE